MTGGKKTASRDPNEILALMEAARSLGPRGALRPHTVATLIGLLVSYGLRACEALRLDIDDVDLVGDLPCLQIRRTRSGSPASCRCIPRPPPRCGPTWSNAALSVTMACAAFFVSERGARLHYHVLARTFLHLACSARTARVGWPASHPTVKFGHFRAGVHRPFGGTRGRHRHGNRHSRGWRPSTRAPRASACEPYRELIVEAFGADVPAPRGDGKTGRRRPAAVAPSAAQERFQFPAMRPTGTMDDKRDEAGAAGHRLAGTSGGETASGVGRRSW